MTKKTEQQKEATRFSFDYFRYLLQQEEVIERMVNRKIDQMGPRIEQLVEQKVEMRLKELAKNRNNII